MKLSMLITGILMIGLVFAMIASVVNDFETQYQDVSIGSNFTKYDYSSSINDRVQDLKEQFDIIGDEDQGWFSKIAAGITAIPKAIIFIPAVMFQSLVYGVNILTGIGSDIGIPSFVTTFAIIAMSVILVFALASFWHRSKI